MKKSTKTGLLIFVIILLLSFLFIFFQLSTSNDDSSLLTGSSILGMHSGGNYIAEVYLEGTIENENSFYNQKWLLSTIRKLKDDERNSALVIFINSPGGGVYQADEIYIALQDYKKAGKPVYAYLGPVAASGGYYIACAANKIYANRNTLTGSIGVISGQTLDLTEFLENLGIKSETIHAGKNKNMGNYNEPLSDEQREILQSIADECYDQFTGIVASQRNIPWDDVKALSDGRVYTAKQALNLKLIDGIDSLENTLDLMNEEYFMENPCRFKIFRYEHKKTFIEMILEGKAKTSGQNAYISGELSSMDELINKLSETGRQGFYPAYLCPAFN